MALILESNSDIGAHISSNLCYLIWLRHSIKSMAVTNRMCFSENAYFHSSATCSELPSNISTMNVPLLASLCKDPFLTWSPKFRVLATFMHAKCLQICFFLSSKTFFHHATCSELPSNIRTMNVPQALSIRILYILHWFYIGAQSYRHIDYSQP